MDFYIKNVHQKNFCILFLYSYLYAVWCCRKENLIGFSDIKKIVLTKFYDNRRDLFYMLGEGVRKVFGNFLETDI